MSQTHETQHGSVKAYVFGFILSIILTVVPFYLVMNGMIKGGTLVAVVIVLALAQLFVQLYLFLHIGEEEKPRYNLLSTIYAFMTIAFMVVGSVWIMYNLDHFGSGHAIGLKQRGIDHVVHEDK
ncbi:MAG: cytochrome o ubiquinol oxidase subunit IV [Alphaproteobacteria bacterium]